MDPASFQLFQQRALGDAPAGYALARAVPCPDVDLQALGEPALWDLHDQLMPRLRAGDAPGADRLSLLDVKVELAGRLLGPECRLCWLRCPVDRRAGEVGACGLGARLRPYQDFLHLGEELELIPSHAIYLAGCNYRCPYCSDWDHVDDVQGDPEVDAAELGASIDARRAAGALSLSLVGGLPDVNLPGILQALRAASCSVPVVWNSNMSGSPETQRLLEGVVDAYVADLKYGNEACAQRGSRVKDSLAVVHANLLTVHPQAYVVVRHLVLPGHLDCCALPALDWLAEHLPGVRVNVMDQFQATPEVRGTEWDARPTDADVERAREHARSLGLDVAGPGRIEAPARQGRPLPQAGVAGFSSKITIDRNGDVIFENLSPELLALASEIAELDPELAERMRAAGGLDP